jgi:predicted nucleotidyltransferase
MKLDGLRVDFMPDNEEILGWGNRWYRDALRSAENYPITDQLIIRLVLPEYFVATKLEAYLGRGYGDPLTSQDILILLDGRPEIIANLNAAPTEVLRYVQAQFSALLQSNAFEHAVAAAAIGKL